MRALEKKVCFFGIQLLLYQLLLIIAGGFVQKIVGHGRSRLPPDEVYLHG